MKIGISSTGKDLDAKVDAKFGRCEYFIIVDTESMDFEVFPNESIRVSGGAGIRASQTLAKQDLTAILTGNIGPNAFQTLAAAGLKVFTGVSGTIRDVIEQFKKGKFQEAQSSSVGSHYGLGGGSR
jgi:predicted Fe-Mo cluster-binding NifX family protein